MKRTNTLFGPLLGCFFAALCLASPNVEANNLAQNPKTAKKTDKKASKSKPAKAGNKKRTKKAKSTKPTLVFTGAQIHTGTGKVIPDGVIELSGDTITWVGTAATYGARGGAAQRIDLGGQIVTPGLIGADTTLGLVEISAVESTRDQGRETKHPVRASYDPSTAINAYSSVIPVQAMEGITSAAVAPTGGLIAGQVAWIDLLYTDQENIVVEKAIATDGRLGQTYGASRAATLEKIRRVLSDAQHYRRNKRAYEQGRSRKLEAHPLDLEALYDVLDGKEPLVMAAHRVSEMLGLVALAKEFKIKVVILGGAQAWQIAPTLAKEGIPVMVRPTQNLPEGFDQLGSRMDNAALLAHAGVPVFIGMTRDAHGVRGIRQEAGIAVANGMDWQEALTAVTLNVAKAYGMDEEYGSLEVGKVANLVVWSKDPFELMSSPSSVYIRGRSIPLASRQTQLRDRYIQRHGLQK